jgi:Ran-binding protein 1
MSDSKDEDVIENPDPHFEPIVNLPPVQTKTLEEDEEEMIKLRAKLFRYDSEMEPREWKERGTGDIKILKHKVLGTCRILMRRDKTLKICANHSVLPQLELKTNCGSDRAWVWSTPADFADEEPKPELLAIRFANAENAQKFHEVFEQAKKVMTQRLLGSESDQKNTSAISDHAEEGKATIENSNEATDQVSEKLQKLNVFDGDKLVEKKCDATDGDELIEAKSEDAEKLTSTTS